MDKRAKQTIAICAAIIVVAGAYLLLQKKSQAVCGNGVIEFTEQCDSAIGCAQGEKCTSSCACEKIVKEKAWERNADGSLIDCNALKGVECGEGMACAAGYEIGAKQPNCCKAGECFEKGASEGIGTDENAGTSVPGPGKLIDGNEIPPGNQGGSSGLHIQPPVEIVPCDFNAEIEGTTCPFESCLGEFQNSCCNGFCTTPETAFADCVKECVASGMPLAACKEICASFE